MSPLHVIAVIVVSLIILAAVVVGCLLYLLDVALGLWEDLQGGRER